MAKQYDDENRGALFPNKNKKGPKSPDRSGVVQVGAFPDIGISAWNRKDEETGEHWLSVSINDWKGNSETRGEGALRVNKTGGGGRQPDLDGAVEWRDGKWKGQTWGIAAWKRVSGAGNPYLSIKLDPPGVMDEKPAQRQPEPQKQSEPAYYADDDIPF